MTPTTNTQAVAARREIGKWLNEGTNKPVDREALAQLCAGFDALTRPQEVAVGEVNSKAPGGRRFVGYTYKFIDLPDGTKLYTAPPSTAPGAGGEVGAGKCYCDHHEHCSVCQPSLWLQKSMTATPAAEQGDAKDAARLDWLDSQGTSYGFEDMHEGNRWMIDGPFANIRNALDAAIACKGGN